MPAQRLTHIFDSWVKSEWAGHYINVYVMWCTTVMTSVTRLMCARSMVRTIHQNLILGFPFGLHHQFMLYTFYLLFHLNNKKLLSFFGFFSFSFSSTFYLYLNLYSQHYFLTLIQWMNVLFRKSNPHVCFRFFNLS